MKFSIIANVVLASVALAAPNPAPHRHVSNAETVQKKGPPGILTDASEGSGVAGDVRECIDQLACYDSCSLQCAWPKVCRFANDASCHKCPSQSCQYIFGNEYGNYTPCRNAATTTTYTSRAGVDGAIVVKNTHDANGNGLEFYDPISGQTIDDAGSPAVGDKVKFCDTDAVALAKFGECGPWTYPTIVSPATCHHCQKIRCMFVNSLGRYKTFNNFDFIKNGITVKDQDFQPFTVKFYCGFQSTDVYKIAYSFCVTGTSGSYSYVTGSLTDDMSATCGTGIKVTSQDIPAGLNVSPWLSGAYDVDDDGDIDGDSSVKGSDAGCDSLATFTKQALYYLDVSGPQVSVMNN